MERLECFFDRLFEDLAPYGKTILASPLLKVADDCHSTIGATEAATFPSSPCPARTILAITHCPSKLYRKTWHPRI